MSCVARTVERGVRVDAVWQVRTVAMVIAELERLQRLRVPMEGGLQRQNASRQLDVTGRRSLIDSIRAHDREHDDEALFVQTEHMSFWKDWYRDFYVTMRQFDMAQAAFEGAKSEVQDLKKQRADLRELLQAVKSKVHNEKNLRRMQMNCIRWLNRSRRRMNATKNSRAAQFSALSKAEVQEELQVVETTIQLQSKQLFTLRTKYQKSLHRVTSEVARGKRLLADLDG
ncbi:hypothetical protein Poli38472_006865 [Pythium oligandrum]|uniref:Uncharacterized protein n=1 Tax=Pythium oligandrum TaxID=41045 RepID=A0A8K1C5R5_PYTOL|nr:hypothetical protein Poli38472_006865 [Pythium oligandrum]|eukprot:TMW56855.1 hypothetical protein Poli38472_006865 [Pythium oligandrum]